METGFVLHAAVDGASARGASLGPLVGEVFRFARGAIFATAALACMVTSPKAQESKVEIPEITLGLFPTADYVPVYIAIQDGLFKAEGLTVKTQMIPTTAMVAAMLGGDIQISAVNWLVFNTAINRNVDLLALAEADRGTPGYTGWLVKEDSPIKTLADVPGRKVAVVTLNGNCDLVLNQTMREQGIDPKTVEYITLPIPDMGAAIQRGNVDMACVPEPSLTIVQAQGGVRNVHQHFSGSFDGYPVAGYAATRAFTDKNPNTIAAFKRALDKARVVASSDEARVREILPDFTSLTPDQAAKMSLPSYPPTDDPAVVAKARDVLVNAGVLPSDAKSVEFWTQSK